MFEVGCGSMTRRWVMRSLIVVATIGLSSQEGLIRTVLAESSNTNCDKSSNQSGNISQGSQTEYMSWEQVSRVNEPLLEGSGRKATPLSLQDCIKRALVHNLDMRISGYEPAIGLADVVKAEAVFDAVLFGSSRFDVTDRAYIDSGFTTTTKTIVTETGTHERKTRVPTDPFTKVHDYNYALGLRKRLPTGASIEMAERLRRFRSGEIGLFRNPFYEYSLNAELRQPLLRDFGIDVNRAGINAARNNYRISQQQFNLEVIKTVGEVEMNYWRLIFTRQRLKIFQGLLRQGERTLNRLREREALDAGSAVVARNVGLIERARANVIASRSDTLQQQDRLLESMNDPRLPLGEEWEALPQDQPTTQEYKIDRAEALQLALQLRPEIVARRLQIDTAGIAVGLAENQALPRLDLLLRQETTGAGDGYNNSWDQQWQNDTIGYGVGLSFEVPLGGNRAAQAELTRARHEEKQARLRLESVRDQILTDVSNSLHVLTNTYAEIKARQTAAEAEEATLLAYLAQEETDAAITADFLNRKLDAEERLASAQLTAAQTLYEYNVAITDVQRAQGTLLRYNNIKLAELDHGN